MAKNPMPKKCPNCGASAVENAFYSTPEIDGNLCAQAVTCQQCDCEWEEQYTARGYSIVKPGESQQPKEA